MGDVFDDMSDINPFADPSVIAASRITSQQTASAQVQKERTAELPQWNETQTGSSTNRTGISAELEEFKRREEELRRRELELSMREAKVSNHIENVYKPPNFPPFPPWMYPFTPCFYINIEEEIPPQNVPLCKQIYWKLCAYSLLLLINVFAMGMVLASGEDGATASFIVSIILFFILIPLSFIFYFRTAYVAFKTNSSFYYIIFFISSVVEIIMHLFQFLGIQNSSWAGFIIGGHLIDKKHKFGGSICILMGFGFLTLFIFTIYLFKAVQLMYKLSGGNLKQAQNEFSAGVWKQTTSSLYNSSFSQPAANIP